MLDLVESVKMYFLFYPVFMRVISTAINLHHWCEWVGHVTDGTETYNFDAAISQVRLNSLLFCYICLMSMVIQEITYCYGIVIMDT